MPHMRTIVLSVVFLSCVSSFAKAPVRYMSKQTLGIEYEGSMRGNLITKASYNGLERMHVIKLDYSPFEFFQFYVGAGIDKFEVENTVARKHFIGNYGFSPVGGITLNSPAMVRRIVRIVAGADFLYLNSKDSHDYTYSGSILDPSLGVLIHAGELVDIEAGALNRFISGTMKDPANVEQPFSNVHNLRAYSKISLCSPSGAFAQLNLDIAPNSTTKLSTRPVDASIGFAIGVLITSDASFKKVSEHNSKYFPEFDKIKKQEKKLKEEMK